MAVHIFAPTREYLLESPLEDPHPMAGTTNGATTGGSSNPRHGQFDPTIVQALA